VKRVLITGGAGFVGSSLALRIRAGHPDAEILALDNLYRRGSELNRDRIVGRGVTFVMGDVRDRSAFGMAPCDLVIDAAAEPSVTAGRAGDARYVVDTNLGGTLNVLEAAREWGAAVLFISTSRVYPVELLRRIKLDRAKNRFEIAGEQEMPGAGPEGISEEFPLDGARTLYGATKFASEVMVSEYAAHFGLKTLIDRCGVIAGPWQMARADQGVTTLWVAAHHYGLPLNYIGYGGFQVRDMLHVDDLGDLVLAQLRCLDRWDGGVWNVGGGRAVSASLRELTVQARAATGRELSVGEDPAVREGDIPVYITDARRAMAEWAWRPERSVGRIMDDIACWLKDNGDRLRPILAGEVNR